MLEVLDAGILASVQDVAGRREWRRYGVPLGGASDPFSARLANRLVGNPDEAALVELVGGGARLRAGTPLLVALTGGLTGTIGGIALSAGTARRLAPGAQIRIDPGDGLRGYLAVAGGVHVEAVLGSRATDLRTGFGGFQGRALRSGDRIPVGHAPPTVPHRWRGTSFDGPIRITAGPQADRDALGALLGSEWLVAPAADRTGVRLEGPAIAGGEVPTQGLLPGAIQVPPDGAPIVMLTDCPVTGGYRVPACVIGADVGRVAQLRPRDRLTLVEVSVADAREAWLRLESELAAVEPLDVAADDEAGWAGSHR